MAFQARSPHLPHETLGHQPLANGADDCGHTTDQPLSKPSPNEGPEYESTDKMDPVVVRARNVVILLIHGVTAEQRWSVTRRERITTAEGGATTEAAGLQ